MFEEKINAINESNDSISLGLSINTKNTAALQYEMIVKQTLKDNENNNNFKERICQFENVKSLEEALELAKKLIPTNSDMTKFNIGDAQCTIIKKPNHLRISMDSPQEFICYDFI